MILDKGSFTDALGSLAIGVLLLIVAVFVGIEVKALLVGQCAEPALQKEVRRCLMAREQIAGVLNLIALQNGADVSVAVNARTTESVSATALVEAISRCQRALRAAFPQVRWLFFEPDMENETHGLPFHHRCVRWRIVGECQRGESNTRDP